MLPKFNFPVPESELPDLAAAFSTAGGVILEAVAIGDTLAMLRADCNKMIREFGPPDARGCVIEPLAEFRGECMTAEEHTAVRSAGGYDGAIGTLI